ncbi:MAG TPA: CPXCG motif-containing cysteine-rich protein [Rudaea sp.]|nr:CPXCG motif-containing cysteine-rich protein [Rudaea sp.]
MLEPIIIHCPYCGESFETNVDTSAGSQQYIEDCAVCCRPIEIATHVDADGEILGVSTTSEND